MLVTEFQHIRIQKSSPNTYINYVINNLDNQFFHELFFFLVFFLIYSPQSDILSVVSQTCGSWILVRSSSLQFSIFSFGFQLLVFSSGSQFLILSSIFSFLVLILVLSLQFWLSFLDLFIVLVILSYFTLQSPHTFFFHILATIDITQSFFFVGNKLILIFDPPNLGSCGFSIRSPDSNI